VTYSAHCAACDRPFTAAHPRATTCGDNCRAKLHRARLLAQRARLAAEAERALKSGDVSALEAVARAVVARLTR